MRVRRENNFHHINGGISCAQESDDLSLMVSYRYSLMRRIALIQCYSRSYIRNRGNFACTKSESYFADFWRWKISRRFVNKCMPEILTFDFKFRMVWEFEKDFLIFTQLKRVSMFNLLPIYFQEKQVVRATDSRITEITLISLQKMEAL